MKWDGKGMDWGGGGKEVMVKLAGPGYERGAWVGNIPL